MRLSCPKIKKTYPHNKLNLFLAYLTKHINRNQEYFYTLYDERVYPELEHVYFKAAIQKRNRIMIDESDFMIAFVRNDFGGARQSYNYAKKLKVSRLLTLQN